MSATKYQVLAAVQGQYPVTPTFRVRPDSIPPGGTFSRGTLATQVNADGSLGWAPHNFAPRTTAYIANGSLVQTPLPNPNNETTVTKIIPNTSVSEHQAIVASGYTRVTGTHSMEVLLASAGYSIAAIGFSNSVDAASRVFIDLDTKSAIGALPANFGWDTPTVQVSDAGGIWTRVRVSAKRLTQTGHVSAEVFPVESAWATQFAGDEVKGIYMVSAQVNLGPLQPYHQTGGAQYHGLRVADYSDDPVRAGIKIEAQSTNLCLNSGSPTATLQNGGAWLWNQVNGTASSFDGGDIDAAVLTNVDSADPWLGQDITHTGGWTFSLTVKQSGASPAARAQVRLVVIATEITDASAIFDFASKSFVGIDSRLTARVIGEQQPGVFRLSVSIAAQPGQVAIQPRIVGMDAVNYRAIGLELMVGWLQVEAGPSATSYIPTVALAATRGADVWTYPVSAIAGFNAAGTVVCEYTCDPGSSGFRGGWSLVSDSGIPSYGSCHPPGPSVNVSLIARPDGVYQPYFEPMFNGAMNPSARTAISIKASGAVVGCVDGQVQAGDSPATPANILSLRLGRVDNDLIGSIYSLDYYPVALPAARLQAMTTA